MVDQTNTPIPENEPPQYDWQTPKPQFEVGRVLGRTFSVLRYNFIKFTAISFLIAGLPLFLIGLSPLLFNGGEGILSEDGLSDTALAAAFTASFLGIIVYVIVSILLQALLVHACFKSFAGETVSLRRSTNVALKCLFPIIGLTIVYMLGVGIGFILLIIPGVLILLGWYIAIPVLIVEKKSVVDALSQSWDLTKGYKRWILLILFILTVMSSLLSAVFTLLAVPFGATEAAILTGGTATFWIIYALTSAIAQAITVMINASAVAAIYYEIRDLKEGITPLSIASVFD